MADFKWIQVKNAWVSSSQWIVTQQDECHDGSFPCESQDNRWLVRTSLWYILIRLQYKETPLITLNCFHTVSILKWWMKSLYQHKSIILLSTKTCDGWQQPVSITCGAYRRMQSTTCDDLNPLREGRARPVMTDSVCRYRRTQSTTSDGWYPHKKKAEHILWWLTASE